MVKSKRGTNWYILPPSSSVTQTMITVRIVTTYRKLKSFLLKIAFPQLHQSLQASQRAWWSASSALLRALTASLMTKASPNSRTKIPAGPVSISAIVRIPEKDNLIRVVGSVKPVNYVVYENLYNSTVKKSVINWIFLTIVETFIVRFNNISMKLFFCNCNPMN